jgi:hypothetical protein
VKPAGDSSHESASTNNDSGQSVSQEKQPSYALSRYLTQLERHEAIAVGIGSQALFRKDQSCTGGGRKVHVRTEPGGLGILGENDGSGVRDS